MTTSPGELRSTWELQQSIHAPDRELRFALMLDYIDRLNDSWSGVDSSSPSGAQPLRVLDLACGPGSITRRVLDRFPSAEVVALDIDPLLLELARDAFAGARVEVVARQLAEADWWKDLGVFDAVLTATAMHWLPPAALAGVYAGVARLLRPGGVFANADHVPLADPVLRDAADGLHAEHLRETFTSGVESCDEWYERAYADPRYEGWWEERARAFAHWAGDLLEPEEWHVDLLRRSGFERAGVVWRRGNDALMIALRGGVDRGDRGYRWALGRGGDMSDHPAEDFTGGELDEPLVDDLLDETRRPDDHLELHQNAAKSSSEVHEDANGDTPSPLEPPG